MSRVSGARADLHIATQASGDAYVSALAWSPDGSQVAAADDDGIVTILSADGSDSLDEVTGHDGGALTLDWSATGVLASGGRDGHIALDGVRAEVGPGWIEQVAWRPDGATLAVAHRRQVSFWTPEAVCQDVSEALDATVSCLRWHPKGVQCAAGSYGGVWLIRANGAVTADHLKWTGSVLSLVFSPDGRRLAHGNQDSSVHFWDLAKRQELEMWGYETKVRQIDWSPDGRWLATGGGHAVTAWDFNRRRGPAGSKPRELQRHSAPISALAFQPGGEILATCAGDGLVLLWNVTDDDLPIGSAALDDELTALAWSPEADALAVGGARGTLAILRLAR